MDWFPTMIKSFEAGKMDGLVFKDISYWIELLAKELAEGDCYEAYRTTAILTTKRHRVMLTPENYAVLMLEEPLRRWTLRIDWALVDTGE